MNILEALNYYNDIWNITFYFLIALALLLGLLWTYYQIFIKGEKKKENLKENIIYNHSEDIIEDNDFFPKKKVDTLENNYVYKDTDDENFSKKNQEQLIDINMLPEEEINKEYNQKKNNKKKKHNYKNYNKNNKNNYVKKASK